MSTKKFFVINYYVNILCKPHKICAPLDYVNPISCNSGFKIFLMYVILILRKNMGLIKWKKP